MTGFQQTAVWLFVTFCGSVTVRTVVKAWAGARVDVAREHARVYLEANRAVIDAQHGPQFVPPAWTTDGEA
ncbi:hypothetical protein [Kitasatospora mediocidica]|uniref:hypothetical protein n=1 Tax=Kitasatospora mediocidica TaxID=58352 RepID=UPI00056120F5|nr:hypothetical protein [Kitasatospora mediocidica]